MIAGLYREYKLFVGSKLDLIFTFLPPMVNFIFFVNGISVMIKDNFANYIIFSIPGVIASALVSVNIGSATRTFNENFSPILKEIFSTGFTRSNYVISKIIFSTLLCLIQSTIFIGGYIIFFHSFIELDEVIKLLIFIIGSSVALLSIFLVIALIIRSMSIYLGFVNIFAQIAIWASNAFYPLELLPSWMKTLALLNPITYIVDGMRAAMGLGHELNPLKSYLTIVFLSLIFLPLAIYRIKQKNVS